MTTVNIRIEQKTKKDAAKVLSKLGLDMSSAIKVFLSQVVVEQGLPFKPTINTLEIKKKWDKEVSDAKKSKTHSEIFR